MTDEERIDQIKDEISKDGHRQMLGPHQVPGKPEYGWFAPVVQPGGSTASSPYGAGKTPLDAAEDALKKVHALTERGE